MLYGFNVLVSHSPTLRPCSHLRSKLQFFVRWMGSMQPRITRNMKRTKKCPPPPSQKTVTLWRWPSTKPNPVNDLFILPQIVLGARSAGDADGAVSGRNLPDSYWRCCHGEGEESATPGNYTQVSTLFGIKCSREWLHTVFSEMLRDFTKESLWTDDCS